MSMRIFFLIGFSILQVNVFSQAQSDSLISIIETELNREMTAFQKAAQPPYFLAYRVTDFQSAVLSASFGSLVNDHKDHDRVITTDLRVGSYDFDNSHQVDDHEDRDYMDMEGGGGPRLLPLDNNRKAIQFIVWQQTQGNYRSALNTYKAIKNKQKDSPAKTADFSKEAISVHIDPPMQKIESFINKNEWIEVIKKCTALFQKNENIVEAEASINAGLERKYFISSEGSRIAQNRTYVYLTISGSIRAVDDDIVPLHLSYFAFEPSKLPTADAVIADVNKMIAKLELLRNAPLAEPYSGPAILNAHSAGVFFHEIFGHRIEGHRLKDESDGQTFKAKIDEPVLPKTLSVVSDPTLNNFNGQELNGYYQFDDEGVKSQKVTVVDRGMLKTFLMSRSPLEKFPNSNGHGRCQSGGEPVSRQSNLIVKNDKVVGMDGLRKMLIAECKKQKKDYGYLFTDVVGGFTTTQRFMPNAFNIFPTEVYRIYVDGRPDELVRGVDLIGTPLSMFAEIKAADDQSQVFTGFCGAESGSVPVTAISPSLFVKRIETQKKVVTQVEKPLSQKPYQN
jgi:TldD protein